MFRKSRLLPANPLDRLRPASGLGCCCSLFEVGLSTAERLDGFPPGAWGRNALPKIVGWRCYNRQVTDRHFDAAEHKPPRNLGTDRTLEDVALKSRHLRGVVRDHLHQKHLRATAQALHQSRPKTRVRTSNDRAAHSVKRSQRTVPVALGRTFGSRGQPSEENRIAAHSQELWCTPASLMATKWWLNSPESCRSPQFSPERPKKVIAGKA